MMFIHSKKEANLNLKQDRQFRLLEACCKLDCTPAQASRVVRPQTLQIALL